MSVCWGDKSQGEGEVWLCLLAAVVLVTWKRYFLMEFKKGKIFIMSPNMAMTGTIRTEQRKKNASTSMVISFVGRDGDRVQVRLCVCVLFPLVLSGRIS